MQILFSEYIPYIFTPFKRANNVVSFFSGKFNNLRFKLKQKFYEIPWLGTMREQSYQKALNSHKRYLPLLNSRSESILDRLRTKGTCIVSLNELRLSATDKMMDTAFALAGSLRQQQTNPYIRKKAELGCGKEDLREFPEMLLWALEPKLLDIIENYVGIPILYQGFAMRRSIADGGYYDVRRWHIDWEDRRTIKIIIYLNDVTAGGGPYEYIPRTITSEAIAKLNGNIGHLSDSQMQAIVPRECWTACLADVGEMIITDTSSVFHRAQPPTARERLSITFCYTSANPRVFWKRRKISALQQKLVNSKLDCRQRNCLPQNRFGTFFDR